MIESTAYKDAIKAHRFLIDYWATLSPSGSLPSREDIDPGHLRAYLANMSIVAIGPQRSLKPRLVGSRIASVLETITGGAKFEAGPSLLGLLSIGISGALDKKAPVYGIAQQGAEPHAWLRLPLAPNPQNESLILCHDALLPRSCRDGNYSKSDSLSHTLSSLAA